MKISCLFAVVFLLHVLEAYSYSGSRHHKGKLRDERSGRSSVTQRNRSNSQKHFRVTSKAPHVSDRRSKRGRRSVDSINTVLDATRQTVQNFGNLAEEQIAIAGDAIRVVEQNVAQTFTDIAGAKLEKTGRIFNQISSGFHELFENDDTMDDGEVATLVEGEDDPLVEGEDDPLVEGQENTLVEGEDDSMMGRDSLIAREDNVIEIEDDRDGSFNTILQATQETVQNIGELTQEQIDISRNVATELKQHIVGSITDFVDKRLAKTGVVINQISSASGAFAEEIISLFDDIDTLPEVNESNEVLDNEIPSDESLE